MKVLSLIALVAIPAALVQAIPIQVQSDNGLYKQRNVQTSNHMSRRGHGSFIKDIVDSFTGKEEKKDETIKRDVSFSKSRIAKRGKHHDGHHGFFKTLEKTAKDFEKAGERLFD
ncbi:hypothetical protein BJV82DRAFT_670293 [Fennellomyces sp. T-0311]|nr:hypothetical protein BJV82DRAFT_670293 [Fennellomyces sp. T-0311]